MQKLFLLTLGVMSLPLVFAVCNEEPTIESPKEKPYHIVKVTTYMADPRQTDSTPFVTASGFKLSKKNPKKHRIIAVSRDLKRKLKFGKRVKITGKIGRAHV